MIFDVDCESRVGSSPKKYGSENQDAFAFDKTDNICCLSIADGAMYKVLGDKYELNGESLSMPMIRRKLSDGHSDDATYGYIKCGSV